MVSLRFQGYKFNIIDLRQMTEHIDTLFIHIIIFTRGQAYNIKSMREKKKSLFKRKVASSNHFQIYKVGKSKSIKEQ